jgi:hypothetical protein
MTHDECCHPLERGDPGFVDGHVASAPRHDECCITSGFTRHHERMRSYLGWMATSLARSSPGIVAWIEIRAKSSTLLVKNLIFGQFNNLTQHCIFEFVQYTKNSVANDKIQKNLPE